MAKCTKTRLYAWEIMRPVHNSNEFPTQNLYEKLRNSELEQRDIDFVTNLVTGTLQHEITIDEILKNSCSKKTKMSGGVRAALRLATYELKFLKKRPDVVLNEYVELVKLKAKPASGLANAILHQVERCDFYETLNARPDEDLSEAELGSKYSLQEWTVRYLIDNLGWYDACKFMKYSLLPAKSSSIAGIVADTSSQEIARAITAELAENSSFLEVGSGNGTKTALLHYFGDDFARYEILELSEAKNKTLLKRAQKFGFRIDHAHNCDARDFRVNQLYDAIFIDAPCTGLGTIRRHPEIRKRITREAIEDHAKLGFEILENMSQYVRPGGKLFYATCTITDEENMQVINKFLNSKSRQMFSIDKALRKPQLSETSDAHFCVMLARED